MEVPPAGRGVAVGALWRPADQNEGPDRVVRAFVIQRGHAACSRPWRPSSPTQERPSTRGRPAPTMAHLSWSRAPLLLGGGGLFCCRGHGPAGGTCRACARASWQLTAWCRPPDHGPWWETSCGGDAPCWRGRMVRRVGGRLAVCGKGGQGGHCWARLRLAL